MKAFTTRGYLLRLLCVSICSIVVFECIRLSYDNYQVMKEAEWHQARMTEMHEISQSIMDGFVDQDFETLTKYLGESEEENADQVLAGYQGLSLRYLTHREEAYTEGTDNPSCIYRILYQVELPLPEGFRQKLLQQGSEDLLAYIEEERRFVLAFMLSYFDGEWSYTPPMIIPTLDVPSPVR